MSRAWSAYAGKQVGSAGSGAYTGVLWAGTSGSAIAMTPSGWSLSYVYGIDATRQVGTIRGPLSGNAFHAAIWNGTANSYADINPAGYVVSVAYATDGTYLCGQATETSTNEIHAGLWTGTPESFVDLHPTGFTESHSYGAAIGKQAGYGVIGGVEHALLWSGSSNSAMDLNGTFAASVAHGMDASMVAGTASGVATGGFNHAVKWNLATGVPFDLNPPGYTETFGYAVSGVVVAGYGIGSATGNRYHALALVNGMAIDLHRFLPSGYGSSYAYGIDPKTGAIVGEAVNSLNRSIAFMWNPIKTRTSFPR